MLTRLTSRSRRMSGELLVLTNRTTATMTGMMSGAVMTATMIGATITMTAVMTTATGVVIGR
jgi:hypothetical protein